MDRARANTRTSHAQRVPIGQNLDEEDIRGASRASIGVRVSRVAIIGDDTTSSSSGDLEQEPDIADSVAVVVEQATIPSRDATCPDVGAGGRVQNTGGGDIRADLAAAGKIVAGMWDCNCFSGLGDSSRRCRGAGSCAAGYNLSGLAIHSS